MSCASGVTPAGPPRRRKAGSDCVQSAHIEVDRSLAPPPGSTGSRLGVDSAREQPGVFFPGEGKHDLRLHAVAVDRRGELTDLSLLSQESQQHGLSATGIRAADRQIVRKPCNH
jgi:hypothetical protein